jgi:hypothetical protein
MAQDAELKTNAPFSRAAALLAAVPVLVFAISGIGMWPENLEWIPGFSFMALVYAVAGMALWRRPAAARWIVFGMAACGLVSSLQSIYVAGPLPLLVGGAAGHLLWSITLLLIRSPGVDRRMAFSSTMAGASLPCAILYGFAPQQDLGTTIAVVGGALLVAAATVAVGKGKTVGLLLALVGAGVIASTLFQARHLGWIEHPHPFVPTDNPLALLAAGIASLVLCCAAVAPYLIPMLRFLFGRRAG